VTKVKRCLILLPLFLVLSKVTLSLSTNLLDISQGKQELILGVHTNQENYLASNAEEPVVFAALPSFDQQIKTSIKTADARPEIIRQYLHQYTSPLEPYSGLIVELSDQYNFDYRWLVAIAQQESSLCKHIPDNSFNCWGWGIYGDKVTRFSSYEDALRRIAPQFTKIFLDGKHYKNPMEVMRTYTPPSDGSWANGVSTFFDQLD